MAKKRSKPICFSFFVKNFAGKIGQFFYAYSSFCAIIKICMQGQRDKQYRTEEANIYMYKIVYFDYCALCVLFILILSTVFRHMVKGKVNRFFLNLLGIMLLTTIFDIWAVTLDNLHDTHVIAKYIAHSGYLILHNLTLPFYILYVISLTDTWHLLSKRNPLAILSPLPALGVIAAMLVNPWTNNIFYLNEGYEYTRGPHFGLLYITAILYFALSLYYLLKYRKSFNKRHFVSLITVLPALISATAIQFFYPHLLVEMFAMTIGIMFMSLMIQRPEERLNTTTGLNKFSAYAEDMKRAFQNHKPMRVIMINISNYEKLRNILGYDSAITLLRIVGDKLNDLNRTQKLDASLYYLDKGRFRIVIDAKNFDKVEQTAELINSAMKHRLAMNQMNIHLLTYVCITRCPEDIASFDSIITLGTTFSSGEYTGKVLFAEELFKTMRYDIVKNIDEIIEHALANQSFSVYYQPIYSVEEKRFNSAEALLRLKDDTYGFISPDLFIPAAEKSGAIHKIGTFVLEEVCRFIASDEYKSLNLDYIEINLSVTQCMQSDLAKNVLATLEQYKIRPEQINLEITETAASYSQKTMTENINILTNAGINFSLDDFGTGYSNMRRIASLPLSIVKLDKSFTKVENNPKLEIVLTNTIRMIKEMNMKIVVEGIETENLVQQFSAFKCDYIQGYFFSRPIPRDDFVSFIRQSLAQE